MMITALSSPPTLSAYDPTTPLIDRPLASSNASSIPQQIRHQTTCRVDVSVDAWKAAFGIAGDVVGDLSISTEYAHIDWALQLYTDWLSLKGRL
jgi:hypothetical protein